jgi:hypothetical protein
MWFPLGLTAICECSTRFVIGARGLRVRLSTQLISNNGTASLLGGLLRGSGGRGVRPHLSRSRAVCEVRIDACEAWSDSGGWAGLLDIDIQIPDLALEDGEQISRSLRAIVGVCLVVARGSQRQEGTAIAYDFPIEQMVDEDR